MSEDDTGDELLSPVNIFNPLGLPISKKATEAEEPQNWRSRLQKWWKGLKLKSYLSHVGLLVSLAVYTIVGGIVS